MKFAFQALFAGVLIWNTAGSLQAGTANELAPSCVGRGLQTLQDYLSLDGECSVGILNFSNFSFNATGTGDLYSASDIAVTPVFNGSDTGFGFSHYGGGQFQVAAGLTATYVIDYTYVIDAGPVGSGADLGMDPPFGSISIAEDICVDSHLTFSLGGAPQCSVFSDFSSASAPQSLSVDNTNPPQSWTAHLNLSPRVQSFATVQDTISLTGGMSGAGFDNVTSSGAIINSTPEPFASVLCLTGLLAVMAGRRLAG